MTRASASCDWCHNSKPVVVVVDVDHRERALCTACWARLDRAMKGLRILHFYGDPGRAS